MRYLSMAILFLSAIMVSIAGSSISAEQFFPVQRIAHAGGGVGGASYLNSTGAMSYSFKRGFRYFELDFSFTKDKRVVCLRNWEDDFTAAFKSPSKGRLSYDEFSKFVSLEEDKSRQRCDQYSLLSWLVDHPSARIITDFKEQNLQGLVFFGQYLPIKNVIPQIYTLSDYDVVRGLGYKYVIWTLYRSRLDNDLVVERLRSHHGRVTVAMTKERAMSGLANRLKELNVPVYVHTVNEAKELSALRALGVLEVYSDDLYPDTYH